MRCPVADTKQSIADELRDRYCDCRTTPEGTLEGECVPCRAAAALEEKNRALRVAAEMLGIEANSHRERQRRVAAEAVERCVEHTLAALRAGEGGAP